MNFNLTKILSSLFGNKYDRDKKLIQPFVEEVKAVYPKIKELSNDQLRERSKQIREKVQGQNIFRT